LKELFVFFSSFFFFFLFLKRTRRLRRTALFYSLTFFFCFFFGYTFFMLRLPKITLRFTETSHGRFFLLMPTFWIFRLFSRFSFCFFGGRFLCRLSPHRTRSKT